MAVAACELQHLPTGRGRSSQPALRVLEGGGGDDYRSTRVMPAYWLRRATAITLLAVLLGVVGLALAGAGGVLARETAAAPALSTDGATVVVGPGETVWDAVGPWLPSGGSRHAYVAEVVALNDIDPAAVTAGTALSLPRP